MDNTITINGKTYAEVKQMACNNYCIVRTAAAGVFAGYLTEKDGSEVTVKNARRLWYWKGAASLSQLSLDGVKYPNECKFPEAVPKATLLGVIEILPCTEAAQKSIESVPIWRA